MPRNRNKKRGSMQWWSDKQRTEAVTTYLATGNMRIVAAALDIPYDTLARWKAQPWWEVAVKEIQTESTLQLDSKLSKIVDKSIDALLDRVENGDFVFNQKTGKLIRKPVNARDVNKITGDMIDRRQLILGNKQKEQEEVSVAAHLAELANEFKKLAKKQDIQAIKTTYQEVTDGKSE